MSWDEARGVDKFNCRFIVSGLLRAADKRFRPIIGARANQHPDETTLYRKCEEDYGKTPACKPAYITHAEKNGALLTYEVYHDTRITKWTCEGDICAADVYSLDPYDY